MTMISLPHLQGAEPATFLAAVGVLSLVTHELGDVEATLGWPNGPRSGAVLGTELFADVDELAEALRGIAVRMVDDDELLPGAGPGFPPRKEGKSPDPTRSIHRDEAASWVIAARHVDLGRTWIAGVVATNDAVAAKDGSGRTAQAGRNPLFDAGPGSVSASGTLTKSRDPSVPPGALRQALAVGARQAGSIGGYLDWRADRDAADLASRRDPSNVGDSVIAWLAFMGIRVAPLVAVNGVVGSSLCPTVRVQGFRKPLVWPVWQQQLNVDAVTALLAHPAIDLRRLTSRSVENRRLTALGVNAVFVSSRISKGNNDGAYGPSTSVWSASPACRRHV